MRIGERWRRLTADAKPGVWREKLEANKQWQLSGPRIPIYVHQTAHMPDDQAQTFVLHTPRITCPARNQPCNVRGPQQTVSVGLLDRHRASCKDYGHEYQLLPMRRAAAAPRAGAPGRRWRPGCRPAGWRARARRCPPRRAGAPRCPSASSGAPAAASPPCPPAASPRAACAAPPAPAPRGPPPSARGGVDTRAHRPLSSDTRASAGGVGK